MTTIKYSSLLLTLLLFCVGISCNNSDTSSTPKTPTSTSTPTAEQEAPKAAPSPAQTQKTVLFYGNSLTAGYGLEPAQAFPALLQEKMKAAGLNFRAINAGLSGETTAGGLGRIDWVLRQKVDIFVLELGGNDGLRGLPTPQMKTNLQGIIDKVKEKYPTAKIVLLGMEAPPNMGPDYTAAFRKVYTDLQAENELTLIPFFTFLDQVAGESDKNQPDGIHPTAEGHRIVSDNLWPTLEQVLQGIN